MDNRMDNTALLYEKARELGRMILASDYSKELADVQAELQQNEEATTKLDNYKQLEANFQEVLENTDISKEEFKSFSERLKAMASELKSDPLIGSLINAENAYNTFVNSVMNVLKQEIMGECGDCGDGNCGSCSGCH